MKQVKQTPWIDASERDLFCLNSDEVVRALALRDEFDQDYGCRLRKEAIWGRNWSVGFAVEKAEDDDALLTRFFCATRAQGESFVLAIPAKSLNSAETRTTDVIELFEPPLIAKASSNINEYLRIRASLIQMIRGSFFVFSNKEKHVLLINNGKYLMLGGERDSVEKILGMSIADSWSPVRMSGAVDSLLLPCLSSALNEYG